MSRIGKTITYDQKKYCEIIESDPCDCCSFCAFTRLCELVIQGRLEFNKSPMAICCTNRNQYTYFVEENCAQQYCLEMNYCGIDTGV